MKNGRGFLAALLVILLGSLCAESGRAQCKAQIKYQGTNFTLGASFLNFKGSFGTENKVLQVASDLAQIFDLYESWTCNNIQRLSGTNRDEAILYALEGTQRLAELSLILTRSKNDPAADPAKLLEWVNTSASAAKEIKSKQPDLFQNINLQGHLQEAGPELYILLSRRTPEARIKTWDLIAKDKRAAIHDQLAEAVKQMAIALKGKIEVNNLRANIFMPGGDGYLYLVSDLVVNEPPPAAWLPVEYGVAGAAFSTGNIQIEPIPPDGDQVPLHMGRRYEDEQDRARKFLVGRVLMRTVDSVWIISVPVQSSTGIVAAVMNLTSTQRLDKQDLSDAFYHAGIVGGADTIDQKIGKLLVFH